MVERNQRPDGSDDTAGWAPPDTPPSSYGAGLAATDRPGGAGGRPASAPSPVPAPGPASAPGSVPAPGPGAPTGWPARRSWPASGRPAVGLPPPAAYPSGHRRPGPPPGWAGPGPTWPAPGHGVDPGTGRPAWPRPGVPWTPEAIAPPRPYYREPHPIQARSVWAGIGSTVVWFGMFAAISWSARAYAWSTIGAAVLALLAAVALLRYGDRGVAVGVAATAGCCLGIAGIIALVSVFTGHWLLW